MPHKGQPRTSTEALPACEHRVGADLLLSLAETASGQVHTAARATQENSQNASVTAKSGSAAHSSRASAKNIHSLSTAGVSYYYQPTLHYNPVTPSHLHGPTTKNPNMHMSLHGNGTHRLVPSPIKLPKCEQQKNRSENSNSDKNAQESEESASEKKNMLDDSQSQSRTQSSPTADNTSPTQEAYEGGNNTVISPASSNDGQKSPSDRTGAPTENTQAGQSLHHPYAPPSHYHDPTMPSPVGAHFPHPHGPPIYHHHHAAAAAAGQPWMHHHPHHPVSFFHHPMAPGAYGAPPPQYFAMAAHPPPYAAASPSAPQPQVPPSSKTKERDLLKAQEVQKNVEEWQKTRATIGNKARCVPVEHPTRARKLSSNPESIDTKLPEFPLLVNFPEHLTRGQTRGTGESKGLAPEGKRHCVMCGQLRICSSTANRLNRSTAPAQADSTVHIIPRQNKGVCTACDVAVWNVKDVPDLDIKWCKGCKNFRPWPAFGEKGLATKCARCRNRQREKYALQKKRGQYDFKKEDDILAAQGLSNLMRAQNA